MPWESPPAWVVFGVSVRRERRYPTEMSPLVSRPRAAPIPGALELTGRSRAHVRQMNGVILQPAALRDFMRMKRAAARVGIDLSAASSFRDFARQVLIWNQKWRGERPLLGAAGEELDAKRLRPEARARAILIWSAPPGASRHHWGSDLDVYDRAALGKDGRFELVPEEYGSTGPFARLTDWLDRHMVDFGFYRPYATDRGGVRPEPWHLSHIDTGREASRRLRLATIRRAVTESDLAGRDTLLRMLPRIYPRYVRAVDPPPDVRNRSRRRATA
jgi:LAS superfamily LD-carboxypeptidase LdcB